MMTKNYLFNGLFLAMMLVTSTSMYAQYSGGTGTSTDPYQISTKADLVELSNTSGDWSAFIIQTSGISFNADKTWLDRDGILVKSLKMRKQ